MKIKINGRDMAERMNELEQRENQYFDLIKSAAFIITGALLIICLPGVVHAFADIFIGFGQDIITAYRSIG